MSIDSHSFFMHHFEHPKMILSFDSTFVKGLDDIPTYPRLPFLKSEDFDLLELTKHLTSSQRKAILEQTFSPDEIIQFSDEVNSEFAVKGLLQDAPDSFGIYPQLGLRARFQNLISEEQFTTLCLLNQAVEQLIYTSYSNVEGSVQLEMKSSYDKDDFHVYHVFDAKIQKTIDRLLKNCMNFTNLQLIEFKEKLLSLSSLEQYFYTFKIPSDVPSWSPLYNEILNVKFFWQPVDSIESKKQKLLLLPSFSMLQIALQINTGRDAVALQPLLGKCTTKTVEHYKMKGKRNFNIGMLGAEVPLIADGSYAGRLIFSFHDAYHAVRDSLVPNLHKLALVRINTLFKEALASNPDNKHIKKIKWLLIDGELHIKNHDLFGIIFERSHIDWQLKSDSKLDPLSIVINDMVNNRDVWETKFYIDKFQLSNNARKLYEKLEWKMIINEYDLKEAELLKKSTNLLF